MTISSRSLVRCFGLLSIWMLDGGLAAAERPNVVVLLADDMGYSDLGCYGGEIETPNIDQLAADGIRLTHFYNCGKCCPTRASLLTGLYPHQAGVGWMVSADLGSPGYRGDLNRNCVTIAEAMGDAGYRCYMAGKWHLTPWNYQKGIGPSHNWPLQRGFQRFYGTVDGSGNYFGARLFSGNERIPTGDDFYYTDAISDATAKFVREHAAQTPDQPFFAYVAYTAPHFPLHAKPADIKKYLGRYREGWRAVRNARHARQIAMGIIDADWPLPSADAPLWSEIPESQRDLWDKRMAVYAAQVDCMDQGVGRIVDALEATDQLENTLLLFLSDNGGCSAFKSRTAKDIESLGTGRSYESYRREWANVSNTPFRLYKRYTHEGGIAAPLVARWPARLRPRREPVKAPAHVIDVMATCLDVAGANYPIQRNGRSITPLEGRSLLSILSGEKAEDRSLFWEYAANRAIRTGHWKAVARGLNEPWELYNLESDRTETKDLASVFPEVVSQLEAEWNDWATRCHVLPLNGSNKQQRLDAAVRRVAVDPAP